MTWKRLKDIVASTAVNSNKMLAITAADVVTTVVGEDVVQEAISNSNTVKNVFNSQVSTAITNDAGVQNSFNNQVSNAITNDAGVQTTLTTSINNINNQAGTTVTYVNPPTVNGQPLLALPTSTNDGDHLMYDGLGTTDVSAKKLLVKASAAERSQLVNFGQESSQQRTAESFERILNDFYRFSHGGAQYHVRNSNPNGPNASTNHADPNEENGWELNINNEITQRTNSEYSIGFASPAEETYDTYDAIVHLKVDSNNFTRTIQHNNIAGGVINLPNHEMVNGTVLRFTEETPAELAPAEIETGTLNNPYLAVVIDDDNFMIQEWNGASYQLVNVITPNPGNQFTVTRWTDISNASDDDLVGFILALNRGNPNNDNANTPADNLLTVSRSVNRYDDATSFYTQKAGLCIIYNNSLAEDDMDFLTVGNPLSVIARAPEADFPGAARSFDRVNGWLGYNGCALKIERRPDSIRIWAIDNVSNAPGWSSATWGNDPVFDIDLVNGDQRLNQFQVPGNWGLFAESQAFCSWGDLMFNGVSEGVALFPQPDPAINNMVFDVEAGITYIWSDGDWIQDPQGRTIHDFVDSGQMLLDTASGSLYVKDNGELQLLQSQRSQGVVLTDDYQVSVNDIAKLIIADVGCSTLTFDGQYGIGWNCTILNKSGATITLATDGDTRFGDFNAGSTRTEINLGDSREAKCYGNGHNGGANIHVTTSQGDYGT